MCVHRPTSSPSNCSTATSTSTSILVRAPQKSGVPDDAWMTVLGMIWPFGETERTERCPSTACTLTSGRPVIRFIWSWTLRSTWAGPVCFTAVEQCCRLRFGRQRCDKDSSDVCENCRWAARLWILRLSRVNRIRVSKAKRGSSGVREICILFNSFWILRRRKTVLPCANESVRRSHIALSEQRSLQWGLESSVVRLFSHIVHWSNLWPGITDAGL